MSLNEIITPPARIPKKRKLCEQEGCKVVNPSFNIRGEKGRFCVTHKTTEMVNVACKKCEQEGCEKQPSFDTPGGKGRFALELVD